MCEAYVIPFLFGSFFTVCHPYIDVHFLKCFFLLLCKLCHNYLQEFIIIQKRVSNVQYSLNKKSAESHAPGMSITSAAVQSYSPAILEGMVSRVHNTKCE